MEKRPKVVLTIDIKQQRRKIELIHDGESFSYEGDDIPDYIWMDLFKTLGYKTTTNVEK